MPLVRDLGGSFNSAGASVALPVGAGIPAGSLICIQTIESIVVNAGSVADTAGNIYQKLDETYAGDVSGYSTSAFYYCWNSKALAPGSTISYIKKSNNRNAIILGGWATGVVFTSDPLSARAVSTSGHNGTPSITSPTLQHVGSLVWAGIGIVNGQLDDEFAQPVPWRAPFFRVAGGTDAAAGGYLIPSTIAAVTWAPKITSRWWAAFLYEFQPTLVSPVATSGLNTSAPRFGAPFFSVRGKMAARPLVVSSPFIGVPSTVVDAPQVMCLTDRGHPEEQTALFTNTNVAFDLEATPSSLVGRTSVGTGPVERIQVQAPLVLADKVLSVNLVTLLDAIEAEIAAVRAEADATAVSLAASQVLLDSLSAAFTAFVIGAEARLTALENVVTGITRTIIASGITANSPTIGTPHL